MLVIERRKSTGLHNNTMLNHKNIFFLAFLIFEKFFIPHFYSDLIERAIAGANVTNKKKGTLKTHRS